MIETGRLDERDLRNQPSTGNTNSKILFTRKETAKLLSVTLGTLKNWEKAKLLVPIRIGINVRYKSQDLDEITAKGKCN